MHDDRAHEGAGRRLAFFGQVTGAERDGDEQQGQQGRGGRSYQHIEIMPVLQCFGSPHIQIPIMPARRRTLRVALPAAHMPLDFTGLA
jgi:hypothetical protein